MKKTILALSTALLLAGCAGGSRTAVDRFAGLIKWGAYMGTTVDLVAHPEHRPAFNLAVAELKRLEASKKIDFVDLHAVLSKLPIKEFRSERASLFITGTTFLLHESLQSIDLSNADNMLAVTSAMREGIERGL